MSGWPGYLVVGLLGVVVGAAELAARYRDDPGRSLRRPPAAVYIAVNAAGSLLALFTIRTFGWDFGVESASGRNLVQVFIAGFGAIALFRTKLFSAAYRDEAHAWGPSRLLELLLGVSDREIDRGQASTRSEVVAELMSDVSFSKAYAILPTYALGLLEGASEEEQLRLAADVKALVDDTTMDDASKAQALGVALIRVTGPDLLRQAVNALHESIRKPDTPPPSRGASP